MPIKSFKCMLREEISSKKASDTGMAMVLVSLLVYNFFAIPMAIHISIALLLLNMIVPQIFRPVAFFWLGLSTILGTVVSKVLLSIIFLFLLTPLGLLKRIVGSEPLQLKRWKRDDSSAFRKRDITFCAEDIAHPF